MTYRYPLSSLEVMHHMELLVFPLQVSMDTHGGRGPGKMGQVPVHNRQEKVLAAKAGVRRRRGVRMQVVLRSICRVLITRVSCKFVERT